MKTTNSRTLKVLGVTITRDPSRAAPYETLPRAAYTLTAREVRRREAREAAAAARPQAKREAAR